MIKAETYKMELSPVAVDQVAEYIEVFCTEIGLPRKQMLRYRLAMEEVVLHWAEHKAGEQLKLSMGKRFRQYYIELECQGLPMDPYGDDEDAENSAFVRDIRQSIGVNPVYSYKNGKNRSLLQFVAKQISPLKKIGLSVLAAFVIGMFVKTLFPASVATGIMTAFIDPLNSAVFRMLGYVAGPLILLSVMWGIYGIGDATTLGRLGKDLIIRFLSISFVLSACCTLMFPLFHLNMQGNASGESAFQSIFEMLLDIIPSNIITPLSTNNTLQLIFSATIIGIAMLFLGKDVHTVADVVEQVNAIVRFLMEFISRLIPLVVFLIILRMILNDTLKLFVQVWGLVVIYIAESIVFAAVITIFTSIKNKVSPLILLKKSVPTFLISITTASSAAAFGSNVETCEKGFGIDNSLTSFGIPLGMVIYKTGCVIYYVLVCLYFAKLFDVPCSASWLISAGFISFMMSFSAPPVPGGSIIAYTLLFDRLAIPSDALACVIAVDVIFDFLQTVTNMYSLPLAIMNSASVQGLLNYDILKTNVSGPAASRKN